jgi:plastocyanin
VRARKMVLGGLMVVLLLGLVGCGSDSDSDDNRLGSAGTADLVINDEFPFYDNKTLELPRGREITFTVFNEGNDLHNITIPGFTIDMDVQPGQTIEIKLPATSEAPRDGFWTMYCKYHQHEGEAGRIELAD